jgi:L-malate glycosyltransferase
MRPINLLIFEPYPQQVAGNIRTLLYILEFTDRSRVNPIIIVPFETDVVERIRSRGTECIVLKPSERVNRYGGASLKENIWGRVMTFLGILEYNIRVARLVRDRKIDVIYSNCIRSVLTIGIAAWWTKTPHLWYIKGELGNPILDRIGFFLADKILFFCEANKHDKYPDLIRRYNEKLGILKIGLDDNIINDVENRDLSGLKTEMKLDKDKTNIIVLGQLYRPKGVHFLLKALGEVVKEFPNFRLYVVGDHILDEYRDYRSELIDLINRLRLENHVIFTGWRKDAMDILSLMDILVHPSLSEGFGRAVLEAMALGKPVIASRVGGLREIIEDGVNGFLVDPGDSSMIANRLSTLIKDRELMHNMGSAARAKVLKEYLIQDKVAGLEQIWADMSHHKVNAKEKGKCSKTSTANCNGSN